MSGINWSGSLGAISQYINAASKQDVANAKSRYSREVDVLDEQQKLDRAMKHNERAKANTKRRQGNARLFATIAGLAASLIPGMQPIGAALIAGGASGLGQAFARNYRIGSGGVSRASKPGVVASGKFLQDTRKDYNRGIKDWRKDLTTSQLIGTATDALSGYMGAKALDKEGLGTLGDIFNKLKKPQWINPTQYWG